LGNVASTTGAWSADAAMNFETLYSKSKYLKEVNRRLSANNTQNANARKFQPKSYKQTITLEQGKKQTINHRLNSEKFSFTVTDKNGKPLNLTYKAVNNNSLEITPKIDADSVQITMESIDPNVRNAFQNIADFSARTLMMLRRVSVTYRKTNSMVLPGFLPEPGLFGQEKYGNSEAFAPGLGFAFGFFDKENTIVNARNNGWLYSHSDTATSAVSVQPATTAKTVDLDIKVNLEPIPGLKIDLNAKSYSAENMVIQYMFGKEYATMPKTLNGSYNITQIALATAFNRIGTADENYYSKTFNKMLENREFFARKLESRLIDTEYPTTGFFGTGGAGSGYKGNFNPQNGTYSKNSTDVLIPSFLAAYTGRDVESTETNPFLSLINILPNWRISYDGLSKLPFLKDNFRTVSLTHAYTCGYSIANYTSHLDWVEYNDKEKIGYILDENNHPIPSSPYDIATVTINEQFAPLIGVNVVLKNSMTAKAEYRKQRNLSLNLSSTQLIEMASEEFVLGFGYTVKNFDVILRLKNDKQTKISNDLKFNADVSYKDVKSLLRKIDENITQASNGNKLISIKLMAYYVFSSKINIQLFFDHQ
jgi:cell surface protein SprA